ncbi:hypothetical protein A3F56_00245 [Candidatus Kaiserbacteria bacterium RIFCSPHIGHO2_12_FULL_55_13]|uniref:Uncharacterized protein n=1 Tax=Candidatus Kaiserbacteria bacterium RIFCSPHIGHO2_01_FULL_54_36b TaxID=1798483 RepID=A0A1F6CI07_9BACT|nr:MAG: hypothetical protein A2704_01425 [Candidatus Kaiserbacteria bacterium RIFCSPHIGHO2_01_FULL_54_36b]OGG78578.1 MAG: hypothetical protein A3F56_00245 [Candidatus Kaiserbacteria bacterium RIFCSPHIGHO2_12_FULL_55_13]
MAEAVESLGRKPLGVPDRTSESPEQVAATVAGAINFLEQLPQEKRELDEELVVPRATLTHAVATLKYAQGSGTIRDSAQVVDILFEEGIPFDYQWSACARLNISLPGGDLEEYIKSRFFGNGAVYDARLNFKLDPKELIGGGKEWLNKYTSTRLQEEGPTPEAMDRLQALAKGISSKYGSSAAAITRLMFVGGADESTLQRFTQARMAEAEKKQIPRGNVERKNFFEKMQDFLGVYIDVTTKVIRNAKPGTKEIIEQRSKEALTRFMGSRLLQIPYIEPGEEFPDPFSIFTTMMRTQKDMNPWVLEEANDTIFDVKEFYNLIKPEVGRGLVADAAFFLNNYKEALFIQDIHKLLNDIDIYREKRRTEGRPADAERRFGKHIDDMTKEVLARMGQKGTDFEHFDGKRHLLEQFASRQSRGLSAFSVLLRMVDAQKVARDATAKTQLNSLLSGIRPYGIEGDNVFKTQILASSVQMLSDNPDPYLDVPLLGLEGNLSIRSIVINKSQNWFDEEILARGPYAHTKNPRNPPERPLITPRDLIGLTREEIEKAELNFNTAKGAGWTLERPWIVDAGQAMSKLPESYQPILGFARGEADSYWNNAGDYVTAFYPSASNAMADIVSNLFPSITDQDYIIAPHGEYDSMIAPFVEKGAQLIAIHCNERSGVTGRARSPSEIFAEIEETIARERALRDGRLPLAFVVSSKTRLGDATGVVPLEMHTRKKKDPETGQIIEKEAVVGERTPNSFGLAKILHKYSETFPDSRTVTDFSQSLGRNDRGEDLNLLKPDVMVASGGKAPGVRSIAVAMIRKTLHREEIPLKETEDTGREGDYIEGNALDHDDRNYSYGAEQWERRWTDPLAKLTPGKGTIDIDRIASLGVALQHLNSRVDTWGLRKRADKRGLLTQREIVAEHHGDLTEYAIAKTQEHASKLLRKLQTTDFPIPISDVTTLLRNPVVQQQFGCQVVYPVHRKKIDYTFVTLAFPNLGSVERKEVELKGGKAKEVPVRTNYIPRSLERQGFPRGYAGEQCMLGGNGFRVSFNTHQNTGSLDRLFDAFVDIHAAFLRREVEKSRESSKKSGDPDMEIKTFEDLMARTPNVLIEEWVED